MPIPISPNTANTDADPLVIERDAVISKRDAVVMRMAAERTGGIFIDGNRDDAPSALASHLLSIAHETSPGSSRPAPKERRTMFIILAAIAFGASKFALLVSKKPSGGRRNVLFASLAAIMVIFTSCSEGKLLLVEANYLHSRGRYDEALIPYLKALNFEDSAPYAEYGLGLTFYSLDEGEAALKRYESSKKMLEAFSSGEHSELRYRNNYNSGIVFFEEGEYYAAAEAFKNALRENPRRLDAKRNLELSLMSITKQANEDNNREKSLENETREILFDYIKQEEQQRWQSRECAPDEKPTGPDY
jgi:Ca-activated chloride channel family protein